MTRHRGHTRLLSLPVAMLAVVALATSTNAAGLRWSEPLVLREHRDVYVTDAAFGGENVAILWVESASGSPTGMRVRSSDTGGSSFAPATVFADAVYGRVAMCGGDVYAVYEEGSGADRVIKVAHGAAGSGLPDVITVADGPGEIWFGSKDIACTGSRIFVSWFEREREGAPYRLHVASAIADGSEFDPPIDLGGESCCEAALAASDDGAYALYRGRGGTLRLARWTIGSGPDHALSFLGSSVVVRGGQDREAYTPVIAADGDTVAIAWGRCAGTYARVSHDGGATWEQLRQIKHFGCGGVVEGGSEPLTLALSGDRTLLSYITAGIGDPRKIWLVRTSDDFVTQRETKLGQGLPGHFVGFLTIAGRERIGDAFSNGSFSQVKFRRQQ